jgi:hypothetical protein
MPQDLLATSAEYEICFDCRWPFDPGVLNDDFRCLHCAAIFETFGEETILEEDCS